MNFLISNKKESGFGLVETLVSVALFALISTAAYGGFVQIMEGVKFLKFKNAANNLANEQIEILRNLPYVDVGIVNGIPAGKIQREQTITREGIDFKVVASIRDVDDPFDGQIGETPNDLSPADYKQVQFDISCINCPFEDELKYYARVSSLALETQGNNGALFVRVFDSNGVPLENANVVIQNSELDPVINISEVTNNMGVFQIVDAPTGTEAYRISATKNGYSTDRTYAVGDPDNPIPNKPHSNVATGEVTQVSFYIDKLSRLEINTKRNTCQMEAEKILFKI
jgi:prepilin-type N-terminal cleavage/methylation domain-containing protein